MKTAIGVDIGGTKISMVLGTEKGKILARREIPTLTGKKTRQGVRNLVDNLHQLIQDASVKKRSLVGIGVGIPGAVNSEKGLVPRSPHLGGWKNLPLRRILERALKLPVAMKNDANATAIGEKYFGACKKAEHFIYVTVSTGVGGGLVVNGKLVEGCNYVGGEIGHISVVPLGDSCKCGKNGCLEAYASGTAITRYVKRELKKYPKTKIKKLAKGSSVSAKVIALTTPWLELIFGSFLILGYAPRISSFVVALFSFIFIGVIVSSWIFAGVDIASCGCFGQGGLQLTPQQILILDIVDFILAIGLFRLKEHRWSLDSVFRR